MSDLGSSILVTMAPIFVLMIGMLVYGFMKNRGKDRNTKSKRETDALIEAQAMLAKYQKEQAEKEAKPKEEQKKTEDQKKEESEISSEAKNNGTEHPKTETDTERKAEKPSVEAPIQDTSELEPDIDKLAE